MLQQAPLLLNAARQMIQQALADSQAQFELTDSSALLRLIHKGECDQCEVIRINLAREVAAYLATTDGDMRAIYWYDPDYATGEYEQVQKGPSSSSGLTMLAWTTTKKATFSNSVKALGEALEESKADIACPKAVGQCFNLDVTVVDDAQVAAHSGYGALLNSIWVRPVQLWHRQ